MTALKVILLLAVVISAVSCRPTHCERWKGDKEYRCAKDNYRADSVHIRNIADDRVSFKIGKWLSTCGRPGTKYSDQQYDLGRGGSVDVEFGEVGPNACNEMFIYECKVWGRGTDCLNIVVPSPN